MHNLICAQTQQPILKTARSPQHASTSASSSVYIPLLPRPNTASFLLHTYLVWPGQHTKCPRPWSSSALHIAVAWSCVLGSSYHRSAIFDGSPSLFRERHFSSGRFSFCWALEKSIPLPRHLRVQSDISIYASELLSLCCLRCSLPCNGAVSLPCHRRQDGAT